MASEQAMCAKYILESVLYWAEEYHMDGFRFDLMGLLDVELMNRIRKELDARYGTGEKLVLESRGERMKRLWKEMLSWRIKHISIFWMNR